MLLTIANLPAEEDNPHKTQVQTRSVAKCLPWSPTIQALTQTLLKLENHLGLLV